MKINSDRTTSKKLCLSGIVIALYVVIMFISQSFAFGAIQVRIATSLYSLSYFFPFLVLPLGISNILSNLILGSLGILDIIGGGIVGILTSFFVFLIKKYQLNYKLIVIPIIFIPGFIVPIWLSALIKAPYLPLAVSVCLGQVIPAMIGIFLIKKLNFRRS